MKFVTDLDVAGAAEALCCSPKTIYRLLRSGKLPAYRVGVGRGDWRIKQHAIESLKRPVDIVTNNAPRERVRAQSYGRLPGWNKFAGARRAS